MIFTFSSSLNYLMNQFLQTNWKKIKAVLSYPMQQSPFVRYHRNRHSASPISTQQQELRNQERDDNLENEMKFSKTANIYLQSLEQNQPKRNSSGKKERKIKVFGIPESKIRKQQRIPKPFDNMQEREKSQTVDQMLIDSNYHIKTESQNEEEPRKSRGNTEIDNENQLQKLLYFSGSSASLPAVEPNAHSNPQESIRTEQVDQILQKGMPLKDKEKQKSVILPTDMILTIKRTDSSCFAEDSKLKISGKQKETERIFGAGSESRQKYSRILEIQDHTIGEVRPVLQMLAISPIPKKNDEIVQTSMWIDEPKEHKVTQNSLKQEKKPERPKIPLPKRTEKIKEDLNIKNYMQRYGSYEQQIENMINKFQRVSNLKGREEEIHRQLHNLTHKKHQSVGTIEKQSEVNHHPHYSIAANKRCDKINVFSQSASNFIPLKEAQKGQNSVQRQLNKDVAQMDKILSRFKEISQIISTDDIHDQRSFKYRYERSENNMRGQEESAPYVFKSEKFAAESIELPAHSCKKSSSQPHIHLKGIDRMQAFNDSQELLSENCTWKEKEIIDCSNKSGTRPPIAPCCPNTARTEKKPLYGYVERYESRKSIEHYAQKKCQCQTHAHLAQEIARLSQKVEQLEKEKKFKSHAKAEKSRKQEDEENSIKDEPSFFQLLPRQQQQSIESIKAKTNKRNSHEFRNQQLSNIYKPAMTSKQPTQRLRSEQFKQDQLKQRKTRKDLDLPPRPKKYSRSPQLKKQIEMENQFKEQMNISKLRLNFPSIVMSLSNNSSQSSIIRFGEATFSKLFQYAVDRQRLRNGRIEQRSGFKIRKYDDCIHYYLQNTLNYHLICYFRGKIYFGQLKESHGDCKNGYGYYSTPKYTYEGQFMLDKKHGKGTINYHNGDIYCGSWKQGKKEGEGILINTAGDIFKGTFVNGKKNGRGQQRLKNGDFYRGEFRDGKLQGQGKYWWQDGSVYEGEFRDGLLHGRGCWRSKENDSYEGQYRQNKKHGKGIYKWNNGMIFTGFFEADQQIPIKTKLSPSAERKNSKSGQRNNRPRQTSAKK